MIQDISTKAKGQNKKGNAFNSRKDEVSILHGIAGDVREFLYLIDKEGSYLKKEELKLLNKIQSDLEVIIEGAQDEKPNQKALTALGCDSMTRMQYLEIKKQHPGCKLIFLMDNRYEMYFEDAIDAHELAKYDTCYDDKNIITWFEKEQYLMVTERLRLFGYKMKLFDINAKPV
jgi:hypothetical protein